MLRTFPYNIRKQVYPPTHSRLLLRDPPDHDRSDVNPTILINKGEQDTREAALGLSLLGSGPGSTTDRFHIRRIYLEHPDT